MATVAQVVGALIFGIIGIATWLGWIRPKEGTASAHKLSHALLAPWGCLGLVLMLLTSKMDLGILSPLVDAAVLGCFGLGILVAFSAWPGWALPPWYREEQRARHASDKDNWPDNA